MSADMQASTCSKSSSSRTRLTLTRRVGKCRQHCKSGPALSVAVPQMCTDAMGECEIGTAAAVLEAGASLQICSFL